MNGFISFIVAHPLHLCLVDELIPSDVIEPVAASSMFASRNTLCYQIEL